MNESDASLSRDLANKEHEKLEVSEDSDKEVALLPSLQRKIRHGTFFQFIPQAWLGVVPLDPTSWQRHQQGATAGIGLREQQKSFGEHALVPANS